jgi:hypothetical protein
MPSEQDIVAELDRIVPSDKDEFGVRVIFMTPESLLPRYPRVQWFVVPSSGEGSADTKLRFQS